MESTNYAIDKIENYDTEYYRTYTVKSEMDKAFHTLEGLLNGINIDGIVTAEEIHELNAWCDTYIKFLNRQPLGEVLSTIKQAIDDGVLDEEEKEDIIWLCNKYSSKNIYYDVITSDLQRLQGILHGILADGVISEDEVFELKNWIDDNEHLNGKYPYDEINSLLIQILSDGKIDTNEINMLKVFFSEFINVNTSFNLNKEELDALRKEICVDGICAVCPNIEIKDKQFCFTGTSSRVTRKDISELINSIGGKYHDSVVSDTDYLIIGNDGNKCWAFSCYGRKVEKAVTLRKKGNKVVIVHENDFWDAVEDMK